MKASHKRLIGRLMMATPFLLIAWAMSATIDGWKVISIFGGTALFLFWVKVAVELAHAEDPKT